MQHLEEDLVGSIKGIRMKSLEKELKELFTGSINGEIVECPFCHYISKNKRFTGKVWDNGNFMTFKCFACGEWRKII